MNFKRFTAAATIAVMVLSTSAFAENTVKTEDTKRVITYDEAVELAIKNTSDIATLDEALDYMENSKESIYMSLGSYYPYSGTSSTIETAMGTLLSSIGSIDGSAKKSRYQKQMLEESAELIVKNYFNTIKTSESSLELAKESLSLQETKYQQMVIKNKLGMLSDNDLLTAENELKKSRENVNMASLAIENTYSSLANALGLDDKADFDIEYNLEYEPFEMELSLQSYITKKASTDLSILVAKASLETAEFQKKISTYETEPYSYQQKQNAVNSASRTYGDTVSAVKTNIANAYNTIMQLESNQAALEAALTDAKTTYATAQTNYNIGNITELQLNQAALAVKNAENNLLANASNHDLIVFQFNHPYMLAGASSGQAQ